jgi:hypothetical protein
MACKFLYNILANKLTFNISNVNIIILICRFFHLQESTLALEDNVNFCIKAYV